MFRQIFITNITLMLSQKLLMFRLAITFMIDFSVQPPLINLINYQNILLFHQF